MSNISNEPKLGLVYNQDDDTWHPLISSGIAPHQHAASAIPGFTELSAFLNAASSSFLTGTAASATFLSFAKQETGFNKTFVNTNLTSGSVVTASSIFVSGNQALNSFRNRNIYIDTQDPLSTNGSNGDIWIKYIP